MEGVALRSPGTSNVTLGAISGQVWWLRPETAAMQEVEIKEIEV
jgi:hypothetical protein